MFRSRNTSKAAALAGALISLMFFFVLGFTHIAQAQTAGALLYRPDSMFISGHYAYVASNRSSSLEILDISNPKFPAHVTSVMNGTNGIELYQPTSVFISGNYAYLTLNGGRGSLLIIDVSDPTHPIQKNIIHDGDYGITLFEAKSVFVSGNYAYVMDSSGSVEIVDVSDPSSPVLKGIFSFGVSGLPTAIYVSGNYLYATYIVYGAPVGGLDVIDVSDPTSPTLKGKINSATGGPYMINANPQSIFVSGNYVYVASAYNDALQIIDVTDPTNPVAAGAVLNGAGGAEVSSPESVFVSGSHAYVTSYGTGALQAVDVSNPSVPQPLGVVHDGDNGAVLVGPWPVIVSGNYAYVASLISNSFEVVNISDPSHPVHAGKLLNGEVSEKLTHDPVLIVPGVLGTEIDQSGSTLWLDLVHNAASLDDSFMNPLQFSANLTPSNTSLTIGSVIGKIAPTVFGIQFPLFDYSDGLVEQFQSQGYTQGSDLFTFPYDWRYGVSEDTINQLKQKVADIIAQTGATKVDVIAHSTGGLLVKKYVMENPITNNIGKAVFVGVPNTGAPKAVKALIEGDDFGNFLVTDSEMKKVAQNLPVSYDLLPSQQYFNAKGSYVEVINQSLLGTTTTQDLNFSGSESFLDVDHELNTQATIDAKNLHTADFDNFDMRTAGVDLYAIDGCKRGTIGKIIERRQTLLVGTATVYDQPEEVPGDGTVPLESATNLPINSNNKYYALKANHGEMLSQDGIRQQIVNIISGTNSNIDSSLITQDISNCNLNGKGISIYSPLSIDVVDQDGNHSGFTSNGSIVNGIPNADFELMGDHKFVYLPTDNGQKYSITTQGTGNGTFTLQNENIVKNQVTGTEVFANVPVTTSLKGTVDLGAVTTLSIDTNGDGQIDATLLPDNTQLSLNQLLDMLTQKVQSISITDKLKQNLQKKIANLEDKIEKKKEKNVKILANLSNQINKQVMKGKIDAASADDITTLLDQLEAQSDSLVLDADILTQLTNKIQALTVKAVVKTTLLQRVTALQAKQGMVNTLSNMAQSITKKALKGKIADTDAQALMDLIDQITTVI